jgi:parvulin-like peptidyl-prolyl isomerase
MAKEPSNRIVTKKQQTRFEKEQRQKKWLITATIVVVAVIALVIIYGVLQTTVLQKYQAVALVGDQKITTGEFQTRVRFERARLVQEFVFYASNPILAGYFQTQLTNIQTQLDDTVGFGQSILDQMIDEKVALQEAAKLGITVSDAEVDKALESYFSFFPDGTPTPAIIPTIASTATLSAKQLELIATPIPTVAKVPTLTPTPEPTATATEVPPTPTEGVAGTPTATALPEPTATPYTREGYDSLVNQYVEDLSQLNFTKDDLRAYFHDRLIIQKFFEQLTKDTPTTQEQVWARHILVQNEAEALLLYDRLMKGDNFIVLAAEASLDTSNKDSGGDLGWFGRGTMVPEFEDAAFLLEVGEISPPVKTDFGYHIIQVLGHEERPLDADGYQAARQQEFQTWLDAKKAEIGVTKYDIWASRVPVSPSIPLELLQQ